ncbi:tissue factor pathway inhibitor 2-like protein [Leptotrombidium deliense]|uniref:Tissue factor pathway inhibitor 2-like protein n=1 Tax=Leptotrombidium deliense TaxID=299467 RepID=A0A443RTR3_9ACAR|nr:tissue factor pathway inhibitor 2-like protein [Leptotrombidium deliense]
MFRILNAFLFFLMFSICICEPLETVVHSYDLKIPIECYSPPDSGFCDRDIIRIYYDPESRTCKPFSFSGCGGNPNRFVSIINCYRICHPFGYRVNTARRKQRRSKLKSFVKNESFVSSETANVTKSNIALIPIEKYDKIHVIKSVHVLRRGFIAVPTNIIQNSTTTN